MVCRVRRDPDPDALSVSHLPGHLCDDKKQDAAGEFIGIAYRGRGLMILTDVSPAPYAQKTISAANVRLMDKQNMITCSPTVQRSRKPAGRNLQSFLFVRKNARNQSMGLYH